jgi:hypothetical protein
VAPRRIYETSLVNIAETIGVATRAVLGLGIGAYTPNPVDLVHP